jgi:FtsP/CotA-like multicopper oxidase with cupredoxin domain
MCSLAPMRLSRRHLLLGTASLAAFSRLAHAGTAEEVKIIRARKVTAKLMGNQEPAANLWTFGDGWPPLPLKAKQGEELKTRFINELDREVTLHWFGVRGPSDLMSLKIEPGEENALDCNFTPPDAGTFWFGPVADVSRLREMGLYGMLIVAEKEPVPGFAELAVVMDDWRLTNEGAIDEASFGNLQDAIGQGRMGNWFTANGAYRPRFEAGRGLVRLRLLNAANVRTMALLFKGADPWVVAEDGQPTEPRHLGSRPLFLVPGQRADLLIEEGDRDITVALDLFEDVVEAFYIARAGTAQAIVLPDNFKLPANPISGSLDLAAAKTAPLVIEGGEKSGMTGADLDGEHFDLRALLEKGYAWSFNGAAGLGSSPWQTFRHGDTVVLDIDNRTAFDQPLHIHGHVWQPISDDIAGGQPWRDTVVVKARKKARLGFIADNPGRWGLHSTVAERMDSGLFTSFVVMP